MNAHVSDRNFQVSNGAHFTLEGSYDPKTGQLTLKLGGLGKALTTTTTTTTTTTLDIEPEPEAAPARVGVLEKALSRYKPSDLDETLAQECIAPPPRKKPPPPRKEASSSDAEPASHRHRRGGSSKPTTLRYYSPGGPGLPDPRGAPDPSRLEAVFIERSNCEKYGGVKRATFGQIVEQWHYKRSYSLKRGEQHHCACAKRGLIHCVVLANQETKQEVVVGSSCIEALHNEGVDMPDADRTLAGFIVPEGASSSESDYENSSESDATEETRSRKRKHDIVSS
jgi:hypothetical protein